MRHESKPAGQAGSTGTHLLNVLVIGQGDAHGHAGRSGAGVRRDGEPLRVNILHDVQPRDVGRRHLRLGFFSVQKKVSSFNSAFTSQHEVPNLMPSARSARFRACRLHAQPADWRTLEGV